MELDPFFLSREGFLVLLLFFFFFSLVFDSLATCSVWPAELVFMLLFPKKYFNFSTKEKSSRLRSLLTHQLRGP